MCIRDSGNLVAIVEAELCCGTAHLRDKRLCIRCLYKKTTDETTAIQGKKKLGSIVRIPHHLFYVQNYSLCLCVPIIPVTKTPRSFVILNKCVTVLGSMSLSCDGIP
eukprot:5370059-Pyramimonas_sp.AAC.1